MNLAQVYRGKRVFVTGNTGFKGSWLSAWLLELGAEVIGYSIDVPTKPSLFETLGLRDNIQHTFGDICDGALLQRTLAVARPDIVFHLAAQPLVRKSYSEPVATFASNVLGTATLLDVVRRSEACRALVNVTSDKCYENQDWPYPYRETDPMGGADPYSASKGCAELVFSSFYRSFLAKAGIFAASARAGNVIGGGDFSQDRLIPDCARAWGEGKAVLIRNPDAVRPWQHVLEPLRGYLSLGAALLARSAGTTGQGFNFGPDAEAFCTVGEVVSACEKHWPAVRVDLLPEEERKKQVHEARTLKLACEKAREILGYRPIIDFERGVRWTAEWYQAFYRSPLEGRELTWAQLRAYSAEALDKS